MENKDKKIHELSEKIEQLIRLHHTMGDEIRQAQRSLHELQPPAAVPEPAVTKAPPTPAVPEAVVIPTVITPPQPPPALPQTALPKEKTPLEEFIGTNLLNKIGIAILVIGIGFGVKYAIEHQMFNPLTRIILGYAAGITLIALALKLRQQYESFSAVLLSGGMAVLYFITYAAFDFYDLIPRTVAFLLMVVFTAFTVFAAIQYNLQIIAIIGLAGAYAVPFLLSDGSGNAAILYSYMVIINTGILTLAFKRSWKQLYYIAFILTWLIFLSWFFFGYRHAEHALTSLLFATLFFIIFHVTFLAYKLLQHEPLKHWDVLFTLLNSFIYYATGYGTIAGYENGDQFLGLFTAGTALLHFVSATIIFRQKDKPEGTFYFVAGLVLVFLTIAVPVQLDGNWVTFTWFGEAALLFWIGRTKGLPIYEKLSYPLIVLAFISLLEDWDNFYPEYYFFTGEYAVPVRFLLNIQFFTTVWGAAALAFIYRLNTDPRYLPATAAANLWHKALQYVPAAMFFITVYFGLYLEIDTWWDQRYAASGILANNDAYPVFDEDIFRFKTLWLISYSAVFGIVLSLLNRRYFNTPELTKTSLLFNALVVAAFLTVGLWTLSDLRTSFIMGDTTYYARGYGHILMRYLCLALVAPLLWFNYRYGRLPQFGKTFHRTERVLCHLVILVALSSELVQWLDLARVTNSFKLGLSILWGCYALFLIITGIVRVKKYIRVTGIALFTLTLVKLFIYDLASMSTMGKTLVMIILGVLLLMASYLYNKYKDRLKNEHE